MPPGRDGQQATAHNVVKLTCAFVNSLNGTDMRNDLRLHLLRTRPVISRRAFASAFTFLLFTSPLLAAEIFPYTQPAFDAAQAAGKPVVIEISASWCPTCKAQRPVLDELAARDSFKDVVILNVDFDSQKDIVRSLGANTQSTLIAFKGKTEVDRSVGVTDPSAIEAMFLKAVSG
jgi:thiol-disulfide isomerase/thioredoxin